MKKSLISKGLFLCLAAFPLLTLACSSPNESAQQVMPPDLSTQTQPIALDSLDATTATCPFNGDSSGDENLLTDSATTITSISTTASPHGQAPPPLAYKTPDGWSEIKPTALRNPNFLVGDPSSDSAQAYVTIMGGTGGGLVMNINRWSGQIGRQPLSEEAIGQLEQITMLGQSVPLFEATGTFTGMQGGDQENQAMMATAWLSDDFSVFVKMIGPEPVVTANRAAFRAFCSSLAMNIPNTP